jgi:hypothetical protein
VRFFQFFERVADGDGSFVEVGGCADDLDLVAKLQAQAGDCGHLQVSARDAGHGDAEAIVKIQFGHGLAKHRTVGHGDTAEGDAALGEDEVFVAPLANHALELVQPGARAHDNQTVVGNGSRSRRSPGASLRHAGPGRW